MKKDIVIIGAGLGGLTAGAKLAREGKKVLLIEQHQQPGGCATTFQRGRFTLEVGLHEMDGPGPRDMKNRVFNDLEVLNNVRFVKIPEFYRFTNGRYDVILPHDPDEVYRILSGMFPDEAEGIKAYFERLVIQGKKSDTTGSKDISVGEFMDSIITNDDLKLILLGNLGYFHDDPYTLSMTYYAMAQGSYYSGGASFIQGGSQKLSDYLMEYIKQHGGEVLTGHVVTGIECDGRTPRGVYYRKKGSENILEVMTDVVVAGNAVPNLPSLLSGENETRLKEEINDQKNGASLLTLYLGFNTSLKTLGNNVYSTFVYDGSVVSQSDIVSNNRDDFSRRSYTFVDYGQVDSGLAPEGMSVGAICCVDNMESWNGLDRKAYNAKKEHVAATLLDRLESLIPGIKSVVEYYELATPVTVKRYTLNPDGSVYGFAQTPSRRVVSGIESLDNIYLASAWGKTGGGFSGAILGGYLCAYEILRKSRQ